MQKGLTWRVIKELNKLFSTGSIKAKKYMVDHAYVKHLVSFHLLHVDRNKIISINEFDNYYKQEHLAKFNTYLAFLEKHNLLEPSWNFKEEDILTLMIIEANRESIIGTSQTKNQISSFYFRHEDAKYLRHSVSLSKAILSIVGIEKFPEDEKDNQYMICVQTNRPQLILLCENIDKLRLPDKFRNADIELWYAGGKNISKLSSIREDEKLPFWYVCDWDHDGLEIYQAIRRDYLPDIKLVLPERWKTVAKPLGKHRSRWNDFKSYDLSSYNSEERTIIHELINTDYWIEEESFSFDLSFQKSLN
jgi:hypothetical protein